MFTRVFERSGDAKQMILGAGLILYLPIAALLRSKQRRR